ncbi:glycoside hydrolase family 76 protein [Pedobacter hiemivivus]|nr:glycoside hydrolase family 76 protein [Pedobacter hiemivivus]
MTKVFYSTCCGFLMMMFIGLNLHAQSIPYGERIKTLNRNIDLYLKDNKTGLYFETTDSVRKENKYSWLWPLCALIQAANEQETLEPGKKHMAPVVKAIDQYYNSKQPPAYQDYVTSERLSGKFYDDNQWIAIAYLDAYKRTKNPKYLQDSKMIYQFMMKGLDTAAGGGLYWKEGDPTTKNTCSNGPGILVALELYKVTKDQQYLTAALDIYNWTYRKLESPEGLFYDAIKIPSGKIDKAFYTYNVGTMLQSNVLLYSITAEQQYLLKAQRLAAASRAHFYKNERLPGHYWFNAVMLRGYLALYAIDKNSAWIDFFIKDAERVWRDERDGKDMLGKHKSLIDQAAMIEIYARLALLRSPLF